MIYMENKIEYYRTVGFYGQTVIGSDIGWLMII